MSKSDERDQAVSDLANALQVALPLSTRLRRVLGDLAQDGVSLEAAVERAARVAAQLQHSPSNGTNDAS